MYFSFKFLPLILLFQRLCFFWFCFCFWIFVFVFVWRGGCFGVFCFVFCFGVFCCSYFCFFLKLWLKKKKDSAFPRLYVHAQLILSVTEEAVEEEGADTCIWPEASRQNYQSGSGADGWGDKQSGGQLCSSVPFWPDSGWRLWLAVAGIHMPLGRSLCLQSKRI